MRCKESQQASSSHFQLHFQKFEVTDEICQFNSVVYDDVEDVKKVQKHNSFHLRATYTQTIFHARLACMPNKEKHKQE